MVDVSHDTAVAILKATQERVVLTIEKNAISSAAQPTSTDDDEVCYFNNCPDNITLGINLYYTADLGF